MELSVKPIDIFTIFIELFAILLELFANLIELFAILMEIFAILLELFAIFLELSAISSLGRIVIYMGLSFMCMVEQKLTFTPN